jgi:hypothetical protein
VDAHLLGEFLLAVALHHAAATVVLPIRVGGVVVVMDHKRGRR